MAAGDVWTEKGFDDLSPGGFRFTRGSRLGKIVSRRKVRTTPGRKAREFTPSTDMSCKLVERE